MDAWIEDVQFMKSCTRWGFFTNIRDLIEINISKFSGGIFKKVCRKGFGMSVLFNKDRRLASSVELK